MVTHLKCQEESLISVDLKRSATSISSVMYETSIIHRALSRCRLGTVLNIKTIQNTSTHKEKLQKPTMFHSEKLQINVGDDIEACKWPLSSRVISNSRQSSGSPR